jgi:hypothetical protein
MIQDILLMQLVAGDDDALLERMRMIVMKMIQILQMLQLSLLLLYDFLLLKLLG